MNCLDFNDDLTAYAQGYLAEERTVAVKNHLDACANCRAELAEINTILESAKTLPETATPSDLRDKVRQRLVAGEPISALKPTILPSKHKHRSHSRYWLSAAAVVLLAVFLTTFIQTGPGAKKNNKEVLAMQLWKERSVAPSWRGSLNKLGAKLEAPDFKDLKELYLAPHAADRPHETCIYAFAEEDIQRLRKKARKPEDKAKVEKMLSSAKKVTIEDGGIFLPEKLAGLCFHSDFAHKRRLAVLKLEGRWEIWDASTLDNYLRTEPNLIPVDNRDADMK